MLNLAEMSNSGSIGTGGKKKKIGLRITVRTLWLPLIHFFLDLQEVFEAIKQSTLFWRVHCICRLFSMSSELLLEVPNRIEKVFALAPSQGSPFQSSAVVIVQTDSVSIIHVRVKSALPTSSSKTYVIFISPPF